MNSLIIFDCDGSLIDSEKLACEVYPRVWNSMGLAIDEDYFAANFIGVSNQSDFVVKALAALPPDAMSVADAEFHSQLYRLKPVPGILEILTSINATSNSVKQTQICVASNSSPTYLEKVLRITELTSFFRNNVFSAHHVKRPKPHPDLFLHAASALNFKIDQCIVVEDSVSGITAAKNAGMKVIGFMGGSHFNNKLRDQIIRAGADFYCDNSEQLKTQLRSFIGIPQ